jgi:hypothetical protein
MEKVEIGLKGVDKYGRAEYREGLKSNQLSP